MPLYSKLIPLRTVVSMFEGSVFHHLYSNPTAGSVPAGQRLQSGGTTRSTREAVATPTGAVHPQTIANSGRQPKGGNAQHRSTVRSS